MNGDSELSLFQSNGNKMIGSPREAELRESVFSGRAWEREVRA